MSYTISAANIQKKTELEKQFTLFFHLCKNIGGAEDKKYAFTIFSQSEERKSQKKCVNLASNYQLHVS